MEEWVFKFSIVLKSWLLVQILRVVALNWAQSWLQKPLKIYVETTIVTKDKKIIHNDCNFHPYSAACNSFELSLARNPSSKRI